MSVNRESCKGRSAFPVGEKLNDNITFLDLAYLYYQIYGTYDGFFENVVSAFIEALPVCSGLLTNLIDSRINNKVDELLPHWREERIADYLQEYQIQNLADSMRMAMSKVVKEYNGEKIIWTNR